MDVTGSNDEETVDQISSNEWNEKVRNFIEQCWSKHLNWWKILSKHISILSWWIRHIVAVGFCYSFLSWTVFRRMEAYVFDWNENARNIYCLNESSDVSTTHTLSTAATIFFHLYDMPHSLSLYVLGRSVCIFSAENHAIIYLYNGMYSTYISSEFSGASVSYHMENWARPWLRVTPYIDRLLGGGENDYTN